MIPGLVHYLHELSGHLRLTPALEHQVLRELYTHLEDRVRELEARGRSLSDAVREATEAFGRPQTLARGLREAHGTGTWRDAVLAAGPYILMMFLFGLHLWQSLAWVIVFLTASVIMTLVGYWRGKPLWMFPWASFALVLPLASGIIAATALVEAAQNLFNQRSPALPLWVLIGLLAYIPLSVWMLVSAMVRVIRFDWLYASLMLLPFPILVRWLLSLQFERSALVYNKPYLNPEADAVIAIVFLLLAQLPVLFVRVRRRSLKIGALVAATPLAFIVAAYNTPGSTWLPALLFLAVLSVLFVLTPALLDFTVGRRSHRRPSDLGRWAEQVLSEV